MRLRNSSGRAGSFAVGASRPPPSRFRSLKLPERITFDIVFGLADIVRTRVGIERQSTLFALKDERRGRHAFRQVRASCLRAADLRPSFPQETFPRRCARRERIVQGNRRDAQNVRLTPIAEDSLLCAGARKSRDRLLYLQRELCAPLRGIAGSDDRNSSPPAAERAEIPDNRSA